MSEQNTLLAACGVQPAIAWANVSTKTSDDLIYKLLPHNINIKSFLLPLCKQMAHVIPLMSFFVSLLQLNTWAINLWTWLLGIFFFSFYMSVVLWEGTRPTDSCIPSAYTLLLLSRICWTQTLLNPASSTVLTFPSSAATIHLRVTTSMLFHTSHFSLFFFKDEVDHRKFCSFYATTVDLAWRNITIWLLTSWNHSTKPNT